MSDAKSLPSFVDLMSSLGLENDLHNPPASRSRSSSISSTSSSSSTRRRVHKPSHQRTVSSPDLTAHDHERRSNVPRRIARYCPYATPASSINRGGDLAVLTSNPERGILVNLYPTSSCTSSLCVTGADSCARDQGLSGNPFISVLDIPASTPISTYARRRTPQASPIATKFPRPTEEDVNSITPKPLSLPQLPVLLPLTSPVEVSPPALSSSPSWSTSTRLPQRNHHTGVRISALRMSLGDHHPPHITPVA